MIKKLLFVFVLFAFCRIEAQFFEGFEDAPTGIPGPWVLNSGTWHIADNTVGLDLNWTINNGITIPPLVYEGQNAAYINRENIAQGSTCEDWLVTPAITVPAVNGELDFFTRSTIFGNQGTLYQIRVSTSSQTDQSSFTPIAGWNEDDLTQYAFNIYNQKIVPLDAYAGQTIYVAFVRVHTQVTNAVEGDRWLIDNVHLSDNPATANYVNGTVSFGATTGECMPTSTPYVVMIGSGSYYAYSATSGYNLATNQTNYTVLPSFPHPEYFTVNPPSYTFAYTDLGHTDTADFCITPNGNHPDLGMHFNMLSPRSGGLTHGSIYVKNYGNVPQSGTVTLTFDDSKLDLNYASVAPSSQTLNTLTWNFSDLAILDGFHVSLMFYVHTPTDAEPADLGDILNYTATVVPAAPDDTPADNTVSVARTITNSYDPNAKTVAEGSTISPEQAQDFLHYTVEFQNLGNAPAESVKVSDMITHNLDLNTLEILGSSHGYRTQLIGNRIEFIFDNINLAAAMTDEPNSHGYISYKIKPANTVGIGSMITNTANIYFDYNYPITTNTVTTTVAELGINDVTRNTFSLYPNPASYSVTIETIDGITIEGIGIFNLIGQKIRTVVPRIENNAMTIDISDLNSGTYFIQIASTDGKTSKKLIKI
jgi:hypothetical protein